MPESGAAVLREFKEKYTELGGNDYSTFLVDVTPGGSVMALPQEVLRIDLSGLSIKDEEDARLVLREEMAELGFSIANTVVFTVWGGAIDPSGVSTIIEPIILRAMNHGGGIEYGPFGLFRLRDYKKGLIIGGIVMEWFLFCDKVIANIE